MLVCGGDGTVGWVLGVLEAVRHKLVCREPPIGIVPLGTGAPAAAEVQTRRPRGPKVCLVLRRERLGSGPALGGGVQRRGPPPHPGLCGRGGPGPDGPVDHPAGPPRPLRGRQGQRLPGAPQGRVQLQIRVLRDRQD